MRATRAVIHLDHFRHNLRVLSEHALRISGRTPGFCVSVKADGYGHGASQVARVAFEEGAQAVAVATVEEGARLRDAGIDGRILLYSLAMLDEAPEIVELGLEPFVADEEYVAALSRAVAGGAGDRSVGVHLKIDTGMGRIGCRPGEAASLAMRIAHDAHVELAGVCTHFPSADDDDQGFTRFQIDSFKNAVDEIRNAGVKVPALHMANSGATLGVGESLADMVRPGITAYGYYPSHDQERELDLRPVMELESRVSFVKTVYPGETVSYGRSWKTERTTRIATIPVGYADGYNRLLSDRAEVLIFENSGRNNERAKPRRVPVVGKVCMDQCMIDCGPDSPVARGDRVVLFGPDSRGPDAEEIADAVCTIPYEVLTQVNFRVPRTYR
ncbi:MAG: alanine racemase [Spirochaetia bacterium]